MTEQNDFTGKKRTRNNDGDGWTEATYEAGVLHGTYQDFLDCGTYDVTLTGHYDKDVKAGDWVEVMDRGGREERITVNPYVDGARQGMRVVTDKGENTRTTTPYDKDKAEGLSGVYDLETGELCHVIFFKNGHPDEDETNRLNRNLKLTQFADKVKEVVGLDRRTHAERAAAQFAKAGCAV